MKNFVLGFFIVVSSFVSFSQNIDINKIDYSKLNNAVFIKINEYRNSIGLDTLLYSKTVESFISKPNMNKMVLSKKLFHPGYSISDEKFLSDLSLEYKTITNNKCFSGNPIMNFIGSNGEILFSTNQQNITYEEFAQLALNGWLNSPPHKKIIETSYKNLNNYSGLASCQINKVGDNFFVIFNFIQMIYM
jgi:hypothetical protein